VLSTLGWDVLATDLPDVVSSVLTGNIARNASQLPPDSGDIQVRSLDWTVHPEQWVWNNDEFVASNSPSQNEDESGQTFQPPFQLIISSDTLYSPNIVDPLLRTLHALSTLSFSSTSAARYPTVYLCIERRDPVLIDRAISAAENDWDFKVERIPHKKVTKAMVKGGVNWQKEDWEGIEIWKLTLVADAKSRKSEGGSLTLQGTC